MAKTIYVGNIAFTATEEEIRTLFEAHGTVNDVKLIMDRGTGRFRGFGFVEMEDDDAQTAIKELDGKEFAGRVLRVNEARDRPGGDG
ncbi:MAG: RNA-binding protein [Candidatus Neomarinimicrobiota bacterium]